VYSIGALSTRTGVKASTLRYCKEAGLVAPADRTAGNHKRHAAQGLDWLSFIKHARDLGFSIQDYRDLTDLGDHPERPCPAATRIARLRRHETDLDHLSTA
jgi:DNA-binding transcriptional MerR regulator